MKITSKILALLLVLALSLPMLFSCEIGIGDDLPTLPEEEIIPPDDGGGTNPPDDGGGTTEEAEKLGTPKITVSADTVRWDAIEGAVGYEIDLGTNKISLSAETLSYTATVSCDVRVRAIGDGVKYKTSNWTSYVTLEKDLIALETPILSVSDGSAVWTTVVGAAGYEIDVNGNIVRLDPTVLTYKLSALDTVRVRALGDGITYGNSQWTAKISLSGEVHSHTDADNNNLCDGCGTSVIVVVDLYAINDLHGKFCDTDNQPGVDELGTYLTSAKETDDHTIFLSSGDMWQGSAESNLTGGVILTEWMNEMGFVSMTLGNHEFDWGEEAIKTNLASADFPFLAINIYDNSTGKRVDYCEPSVMVDLGDVQIGIIGAIGNCYSSISADRVENVNFKTGDALVSLIKAESDRLKDYGADFIVLSYHDELGYSDSNKLTGYVDIIFEGHTHSSYKELDSNGIYHLQGGGENKGITHAEISINSVNGNYTVNTAEVVYTSKYSSLPDCEKTEAIEDKYDDVITKAYSPLGTVSGGMSSNTVEDYVAELYLEAGIKKWGSKYNIVLGGGFLKTRAPYDLASGSVCYADVLSIFPFDNRLVLCSIKGSTLKSRFINPSGDYHTALSDYGNSIAGSIKDSETYYVIVDTYTQLYKANQLTAVEYYDDGIYARDLLADAIREGRLDSSREIEDEYTLTEISELLDIGSTYERGEESSEYFYVKGTVSGTPDSTYGNLYLTDGDGNTIYIYGLYDKSGNRYSAMTEKPKSGDTIVVYSKLYYYYNSSSGSEMLELKNATLIEIAK